MNANDKILVLGKDGVAGSAIVRLLKDRGFNNLLLPAHSDLELTEQIAVERYFDIHRPDYVFFTSAKMGSILYRKEHPVDLLQDNLLIQTNVMRAAHNSAVKKMLFMSSDFIYPNTADGLLRESDFLTDAFGGKDLPYTLAKAAGVKLCEYYHQQYGDNFFTVVPCAFYGINAYFDLERANVVGALIKRFHDAKIRKDNELVLWGTGKPVKEFLFCDDVANACVFLMESEDYISMINMGSGTGGISIMKLAELIQSVVEFEGDIVCDTTKPDGIMHRVLDSGNLFKMGWKPQFTLEQGIKQTYKYFLTTEYA